jgi:hypothetical protein
MAAKAQLLNRVTTDEAPEDALDGRQLVELMEGVRAAVEDGRGRGLGTPGDLNAEHWTHAGVGVSIWMHESGVVVMAAQDGLLVTNAATLDNISMARAAFHAEPGAATVADSDVDQEGA